MCQKTHLDHGAGDTGQQNSQLNSSSPIESLLPVQYRDGRVVSAFYLIKSSNARRAITCSKLHPVILPGKRSISVITLFEYLDTTIGPYREFSMGILAAPTPRLATNIINAVIGESPLAAWILALPVTSQLACQGGIELFGYPKSVKCIDVQFMNDYCSYSVSDDNGELVAFSCALRRGPKIKVKRLHTYSELNGRLIRTDIETCWQPAMTGGKGARLRIGSTEQPIAAIASALELPLEPIFLLHGSRFSAILPKHHLQAAPP